MMKKRTHPLIQYFFTMVALLMVSCGPEKQEGNEKIQRVVNETPEKEVEPEKLKDTSGMEGSSGSEISIVPEVKFKAEIVKQPTMTIAGRAIPGPPSIKITDEKGEPVEGVSVVVNSSMEDLLTESVTELKSDSAGIIEFQQLIPSKQSPESQLIFSSEKFESIRSFHFPVLHGHPMEIALQQQPTDSNKGEALQGPPTILLTDKYGNPTPNVAIQVDAKRGSEEIQFISGITRKRTGYDGMASFDDLVLPLNQELRLRFKANTAGSPEIESIQFSVKDK